MKSQETLRKCSKCGDDVIVHESRKDDMIICVGCQMDRLRKYKKR